MASKIYGICPSNVDVNTGKGDCGPVLSVPDTVFISDPLGRYSAIPDTFKDSMNDYIIANDVMRLLPVKVADNTPSGGEWKTRTQGDVQKTIGITQEIWELPIYDPDLCLYNELVKMNGWMVRVQIAYRNLAFEGTMIDDQRAGYLATIYTRETNTTADGYNVVLQVTFDVNHENEKKNRHVMFLDSIPQGLIGAILVPGTVAGTATIQDQCGTDLGKAWAAKWSPAAFIDDDGAPPTTANVNPTTGVLTIAPAGNYRVAPAFDLDPLGIIGINGVNEFATITGA